MYRWQADFESWPHSLPGKSSEEAQALCGYRKISAEIDAQNIHEALKLAQIFARGMETNPAMWHAVIISISRIKGGNKP